MTHHPVQAGISRLLGRAREFAQRVHRDQRGISAVEFALIVPVMCTLFLASVETTQGLQADRKVSLAARTLSDLASQATIIANTDMTNILDATTDVLAPFPISKAKVVVTGIQTDALGVSRAVWSDTLNGTRYSCGQTMTIPTQLKPTLGTTGFLVLAEVTYDYKPTIGYLIAGTVTLTDRLYTRPRIGETVSRTPSQGTGCI
jgi:Flp pilus assembly protein TadG